MESMSEIFPFLERLIPEKTIHAHQGSIQSGNSLVRKLSEL